MAKKHTLQGKEYTDLFDELERRYGGDKKSFDQKLYFFIKKYSWIIVVGGSKLIKRVMDIVISSLCLIILSPLFLIVAILIKCQDGGAIFYVTERVGEHGRIFRFPKFRTMIIGAEQIKKDLMHRRHDLRGKHFKIKTDPRVTRLGGYLRKTSIDELPQLWCVLKGEMSLVGPRPPLPDEFVKYNLEEMKRLEVKPGITCIWQVSGRSEIPFHKQVELDRQYIESRSLWLDIVILIKTIPAVIFGRGAY